MKTNKLIIAMALILTCSFAQAENKNKKQDNWKGPLTPLQISKMTVENAIENLCYYTNELGCNLVKARFNDETFGERDSFEYPGKKTIHHDRVVMIYTNIISNIEIKDCK